MYSSGFVVDLAAWTGMPDQGYPENGTCSSSSFRYDAEDFKFEKNPPAMDVGYLLQVRVEYA